MKFLYIWLTQLTSNKLLSRTAGVIARAKWSRWLIPHFAKVYQIKAEEAEWSLEEYTSLNQFFTRRLKAGARPLDSQPNSVISPVDGVITGIGKLDKERMANVKGQSYTMSELLGDQEKEKLYQNGSYLVLYLSPSDYHRIHSPVGGTIEKHVHLKGKVYPVNPFGMRFMKRVLSRNERLITYIQHDQTQVALIKVGALNVASIQLSDRLHSNQVNKGDELAYFQFGSTVVLLFQKDRIKYRSELKEGDQLKMGEVIGIMANPE